MENQRKIVERMKKAFFEENWKEVIKVGKKAIFSEVKEIDVLTAILISYIKLGMYEKASKFVEEYMHKINLFTPIQNNEEDIQRVYNIILSRDIAKKIPKENQITFIDVLFNATLPVAKKILELNENVVDKKLKLNYIVFSRDRYYQVKENGIEAAILINSKNIDTHTALEILKSKIVVLETYQMFMPKTGLLNSLIKGSIRFQLWHGLPIKKIGLGMFEDNLKYSTEYFLSILEDSVNTDYFVSPSDESFITNEYKFSFPNAEILPLGDPRFDIYFNEDFIKFSYIDSIKQWSYKNKDKIKILLMFTFRDSPNEDALMVYKIKELVIKLFRAGFMLAYKPHHESLNLNYKLHMEISEIVNTFGGITLSPTQNAYSMFRYFDTLITDYSSVRFDFLVTQKPVILYRPVNLNRKIDNPFWQNLDNSFYILENLEEVNKISNWLFTDTLKEKRKEAFNIVHKYSDGKASTRIAEKIYEIVK